MSAAELLSALSMTEGDWEAAEAQREAQMEDDRMQRAFIDKWLPVWRQWGHTMPGYEHLLESR